MSVKKAQKIANEIYEEFGLSLANMVLSDLESLKEKIDLFLSLNVETDEICDPDDVLLDDSEEDEWE